MKYAGMPFGMWTLFAPSFRNQLTAVFGYGTNTNCSALKKDAESLPRPQNYLALTTSFQNPYSKTIKPSMQLIIPDIHSAGCIFRLFRVIIEITIPINENNGSKNIYTAAFS